MSLEASYEQLVRGLDDEALAGLSDALSRETRGRKRQSGVQMEDIHPRMSAAEKLRATEQIARVLRGEE